MTNILKEKFNINFLKIDTCSSCNKYREIDLCENLSDDINYINEIFNMKNFVCIYSRVHCLGIIKNVGDLKRLKYIKTAINDENGFKNCERVNNCKFIDITDFCNELDSKDLIKLLITYYNDYNYCFENKKKISTDFLKALMYEEIQD